MTKNSAGIEDANCSLLYLSPRDSASSVLHPWQAYILIGITLTIIIFIILDFTMTIYLIVILVNIIYFIFNLFNLYIFLRGSNQRVESSSTIAAKAAKLEEIDLPIYTILIPLNREGKILPNILQNIQKIDYPKDKLDIKILLEENDNETLTVAKRLGLFGKPETIIEPMNLEEYTEFLRPFDPIIIPESEIKTKPRACNYGLSRAKGKFCVIYDAEDDPEPDQLKKAVAAFAGSAKEYICFQGRLNYYNPRDNWLTRMFTAEYTYWFDFFLRGLENVDAPIPLGGTSNHFKTEELRKLGGWDPYNVTEDADLGIWITRRKKKTAILDSCTFEEANCQSWNWIRQRSRWEKGYIQTYFVHMRDPKRLFREMGWRRFLLFQLIIGGSALMPLINPIMWVLFIVSITLPNFFTTGTSSILSMITAFNLWAGNLTPIMLWMLICAKRGAKDFIPYAVTIPAYWLLMSLGAWKGALQLIMNPFYWEKTTHGLSKNFTTSIQVIIEAGHIIEADHESPRER